MPPTGGRSESRSSEPGTSHAGSRRTRCACLASSSSPCRTGRSRARRPFTTAPGAGTPLTVETPEALDAAIARGAPAVTDDATVVCRAESVDVVIEATGDVDFGAITVLDAIGHGKHVVLLNAALDSTVGPLLKAKADAAGADHQLHRRRRARRGDEPDPLPPDDRAPADPRRQSEGLPRPSPDARDAARLR